MKTEEDAALRRSSFFQFLVPFEHEQVNAFADMIWANVNGPNLRDNIAPTRSRADLIIEKGPDHAVTRVRLRK